MEVSYERGTPYMRYQSAAPSRLDESGDCLNPLDESGDCLTPLDESGDCLNPLGAMREGASQGGTWPRWWVRESGDGDASASPCCVLRPRVPRWWWVRGSGEYEEMIVASDLKWCAYV